MVERTVVLGVRLPGRSRGAWPGAAGFGRAGMGTAGMGQAEHGSVWTGMAGRASGTHPGSSPGRPRIEARPGLAQRGVSGNGAVGQGGWMVFGAVRLRATRCTRPGAARSGRDRQGLAWMGLARRGWAWKGTDGRGWARTPHTDVRGMAGQGSARRGKVGSARLGRARQGEGSR